MYRLENWRSERWTNLPKMTQLVSSDGSILTWIWLIPKPMLLPPRSAASSWPSLLIVFCKLGVCWFLHAEDSESGLWAQRCSGSWLDLGGWLYIAKVLKSMKNSRERTMVLKLESAVRIKIPDDGRNSEVMHFNRPPVRSWHAALWLCHGDNVLTVIAQQPWLLMDSWVCEQPATHLGCLGDSVQLYPLFHVLAFKRAFIWPHLWRQRYWPTVKGRCHESSFSKSGLRLLSSLPFFSPRSFWN